MNKERGREREGGNKTSDKDSPVVISSDSYHNNYYNIIIILLSTGIYPHSNVPPSLITGSRCYSGTGRGYTGNVSVTVSGHTCQYWGDPYPQPNLVYPFQYPELCKC